MSLVSSPLSGAMFARPSKVADWSAKCPVPTEPRWEPVFPSQVLRVFSRRVVCRTGRLCVGRPCPWDGAAQHCFMVVAHGCACASYPRIAPNSMHAAPSASRLEMAAPVASSAFPYAFAHNVSLARARGDWRAVVHRVDWSGRLWVACTARTGALPLAAADTFRPFCRAGRGPAALRVWYGTLHAQTRVAG